MSFFYRSIASSLFPSILWHTDDSSVHLTFDDGPHSEATPVVLGILKSRDIKATFFLLGERVERCPEVAQEICSQGHTVGNHGLTHVNMLLRSSAWQFRQIEETNSIIRKTTGKTPRLFRPPFGRFDRGTIKAASSLEMKTVMWDVDSRDYSPFDTQSMIPRVCRQTLPGSILLFHDNDSTKEKLTDYLNPILDGLEKRGYTFSSIVL